MGNGASSPETEAHLKKWENAVNDLSQLCHDNRRAMGLPSRHNRPRSEQGDDKTDTKSENELRQSFRGRRTSSLVSFGGKNPQGVPNIATDATSNDGIRSGPISPRDGRQKGAPLAEISPHAASPGQRERNLARDEIVKIKKARSDIFKSYEVAEDTTLAAVENAHACAHYAVVAAGLSVLAGGAKSETDRKKRVTVEDLFFAVQIPLAALHSDVCKLTEVYDTVREFIDVDNRFKEQYTVQCVHLDIAPVVGTVEMDGNEVGDRQPRVLLPDLRKQIQSELEEEPDAIRFVYFDPFIVQQELGTEDEDDEDEGGLGISLQKGGGGEEPRVARENHGSLACIVDFRQTVQPMVTIAHATASDSIFTHLQEIPLAVLYKAMKAPQITGRSGGYIRVSALKKGEQGETSKDEVPTFFTPELCSGKVLGSKLEGIDAHCTANCISRHLTAVSWALHFLSGTRPNTHDHGYGLPISRIIRELHLPIDVFTRCDLPLDQVHGYVSQYLERAGLNEKIKSTLCPVLTRNGRADEAPTLSVFDLEGVLIDVKNVNADPESPSHMMIMQYDANIAHNVLNIAYKPQWCVLVGYEEDSQLARVIDANATRFSGSWTISLERLHKAITNYGYIILAKTGSRSLQPQSLGASTSSREVSPKSSTNGDRTPIGQTLSNENEANDIGGLRHINSTLQQRFDLLGDQTVTFPIQDVFPHFVYPAEQLSITQLAVALNLLGVHTTVEAMLHELPYDINSLLEPALSLHAMAHLATTFAKRSAAHQTLNLTSLTFHADRDGFEKTFTLKDFTSAIAQSSEREKVVLVYFDRTAVNIFGACNPCGEYGVILDFNAEDNVVTMADVNPNRFYRVWKIQTNKLYGAVYRPCQYRARGVVVLSKHAEAAPPREIATRSCKLDIVPLQNTFAVSPSPQVQALSVAFAQLGFSFTPEEIFYEAYLKTMNDQRRRGSQAFAWRDVEVSLLMVSKINAETTMKVAKKFLESRKIYNVQVEVVEDVEEEDLKEMFEEEGTFGSNPNCVYLCNYRTDVTHSVHQMGPSMAMIHSWDASSETVGLFEAEFTQFGLEWEVPLDVFSEACDLSNEGKSEFGIIKLMLGEEGDECKSPKRTGFNPGFGAAFGGGGDTNEQSGSGGLNEPEKPKTERSPRAVFIE